MSDQEKKVTDCGGCRIREFFQREHTPAEKVVMVAAALAAGFAAGMLLSPVKNGISFEVSVGSHNGCYNTDCGSRNNQSTKKEKK